jgi:3',5'-cyclic AMP phosphodiesterase CpdA
MFMKIIHLSDLHFHQNPADNKQVMDTLAYVKAHYTEHIIVVTGDITDDGHEVQYENAYNALKPFLGRIFIVPGNHDFGAAGSFYSEERARRFDAMLSTPLQQGATFSGANVPVVNVVNDVMFIGVDTNLETVSPFDFACGEVGEIQLKALKELLNSPAISEMKRVLFFHHHPFMHSDPFMEMKDAPALARVVFGRVNLMMFGHKHVMGMWKDRWGIDWSLASDNSPGKAKAAEITIQNGVVGEPRYVNIQ